jgi:hypothetical protein
VAAVVVVHNIVENGQFGYIQNSQFLYTVCTLCVVHAMMRRATAPAYKSVTSRRIVCTMRCILI